MEQHGEIAARPGPSDTEKAAYLGRAVDCLPEEGTHFLGFHLVSELGRGAFSRVFLARQTDLCNREVALKISVDLFNESQTLAQLQHTNIVPIYSAHSAGPLQALCMPYFGRTTLAEVLKTLQADAIPESGQFLVSLLRGTVLQGAVETVPPFPIDQADQAGDRLPLKKLEKLSYVNAMLWIAAQAAQGLAHAHERGIIHRDLKPANIVLGDDGQPMLLDFNLSEDVKLTATGADPSLGGTLPYMAPEHLEAFVGGRRPVDARSDIFSLGVILYEMLTARLPYPLLSGPLAEVIPRLAVERSCPAPRLRAWNRAVSPAVEAIVRRCLASDPARRYQCARDLAEDIERHLEDRPLRHIPEPSLKERLGKWLRRHPRVKSPVTLTAFAVFGLALFLVPMLWLGRQEDRETIKKREYEAKVAQRKAARASALAGLREFRDNLPAARKLEEQLILRQLHGDHSSGSDSLKDLVVSTKRAFDFYQVLDKVSWQDLPQFTDLPLNEQDQLRRDVADLLFWLTNAYRFRLVAPGKAADDPLAVAWDLNQRAEGCFPPPERLPLAILFQKAKLAERMGKKEAKEFLAEAEKIPLKTGWDYYAAAFELAAARRVDDAVAMLKKSIAKEPNHFASQLLLAVCRHNLDRYGRQVGSLEEAAAAYTTCIALKPDFIPAYLYRGEIYLSDPQEKSWEPARADADMVLRQRPDWVAARILHARALFQEVKDRRAGKPIESIPVATLEETNKILKAAVQELNAALKVRPEQAEFYFYRGKLYEALKDEGQAGADFTKLMQLKPTSADGWSFRARARLAELESLSPKAEKEKARLAGEGLADLDQALKLDPAHLPSLIHKARILAELQNQNKDALLTLDRIVALYPDYFPALGQRGLVHARLGQWLKAYDDVIRLLKRHPDPAQHYQAAKIYAFTSKFHAWDREHALKQLSFALRNGYGWERFQTDPDLESLHGEAEYQKLVQIAPILARPVPPRMRPPEKEKQ